MATFRFFFGNVSGEAGDTHDGFYDYERDRRARKKIDSEIERFKRQQEKLREDLVAAYNKTFGISVPEETPLPEIVQAIEDNREQIRKSVRNEVERRVLEKLIIEYQRYEREKQLYDRRMLEDEWDTDAMLAIAHLLQ